MFCSEEKAGEGGEGEIPRGEGLVQDWLFCPGKISSADWRDLCGVCILISGRRQMSLSPKESVATTVAPK